MRQASLKPQIPQYMIPAQKGREAGEKSLSRCHGNVEKPNASKRRIQESKVDEARPRSRRDEFGDDDIHDSDLIQAATANSGFVHIDDLETQYRPSKNFVETTSCKRRKVMPDKQAIPVGELSNVRLENGKWACKHRCKDKMTCKHLCCREGLESPPKISKTDATSELSSASQKQKQQGKQLSINHSLARREANRRPAMPRILPAAVEDIDLTDTGSGEQGHRHFEDQLSKQEKDARVTDLDPWTTAREISDVLQESEEIGDLADSVCLRQDLPLPLLSLPSQNNRDRDAGRMSLDDMLPNSSPALALTMPSAGVPNQSNWLFRGDTSSSLTIEGHTLNSPHIHSPKRVEAAMTRPFSTAGVSGQSGESHASEPTLVETVAAIDMPSRVTGHLEKEDGKTDRENEMPPTKVDGVETWLLEEFGDIVELV